MAEQYCYPYPRPSVTVDTVVFTLDGDAIKVLMIRRKAEPFVGQWALPGGFLDIDEPVEEAALRELREETGLGAAAMMTPFGFFGDPGRDPRGRTISLAHLAVVRGPAPAVEGGDDASEAAWLEPDQIEEFAFDHQEIVATAIDWLIGGVEAGPLGLAMLPDEFGDADVARLHRALGGTGDEAVAWREEMERGGIVQAVPGRTGCYRTTQIEAEEIEPDDDGGGLTP